jgi:hypothetical protein
MLKSHRASLELENSKLVNKNDDLEKRLAELTRTRQMESLTEAQGNLQADKVQLQEENANSLLHLQEARAECKVQEAMVS